MCTSKAPDAPAPPPPPPPLPKEPDKTPLLKKRNSAATGDDTVANGTLMTGSAGVPAGALTLGGNTLLGGGTKAA